MEEFKQRNLSEKLYYIFSIITALIMFFAIPLGMIHEMNPSWGIDIGLSHGIGWFLFGMLDVFAVWTIIVLSNNMKTSN